MIVRHNFIRTAAIVLSIVIFAAGPLKATAQDVAESVTVIRDMRDWETRVIQVPHAERTALRHILSMFEARYTFDERLRTLVVRAPAEIMPAIEQVVERFDQPTPRVPSLNVELTAHVLLASTASGENVGVPQALSSVTDQLRQALNYQSFTLLDTVITRGVDGRDVAIKGILPAIPGTRTNPGYELAARLNVLNDDAENGRVIRVQSFAFEAGMSFPDGGFYEVQIGTTINVREGQFAVVGKTAVSDNALIVVVSARVID